MTTATEQTDVAQALLDAATKLFAEGGYDGTSLQSIADEVGVRKPSLLYHYPSKEELRLAVLRRVFEHWNEVFPRILQVATSGSDRFEGLVGEIVSFFAQDPDRARLVLREMLDRPEHLRVQMNEYVAPWIKIMTDYIRQGQQNGTVRAEVDPEAYVLHVIGMIVSGIATVDVIGAPDAAGIPGDLDRHVRETVRIARAGLFIDES